MNDEDLIVIDVDGTTYHHNRYKQPHRIGGPAIHGSGCEFWLVNGQYHRLDGPAIIWCGITKWYINGKEYTEEEFNKELNRYRLDDDLFKI